jgi:hypothetical protein
MTSLRLAAAAAALPALGAAALAAPPPPIQVSPKSGPQPITRNAFVGQVEARFAAADTNHNGSMDLAEITAATQRELELARKLVAQQLQIRFRQLDTNKDGQLSPAEFNAMAGPIRTVETPQQLLQKLDTNHDGKVSMEEYRAPEVDKFNRADANHDGVVTPAEAAASARK